MEAKNRKLDWQLAQALLGLLARIANGSAARAERIIATPAPGEEIVVISGQRWRVWIDAAGERQASPIIDEVRP